MMYKEERQRIWFLQAPRDQQWFVLGFPHFEKEPLIFSNHSTLAEKNLNLLQQYPNLMKEKLQS